MASLPPIAGEIRAEIVEAHTVAIHGDVYHDLSLRSADDAPDQTLRVRVPAHLCERPPSPGDRVAITLLMSQPTALRYL